MDRFFLWLYPRLIAMQTIPYYQFKKLPSISAVYIVFAGIRPLYVGSSSNLNKRFQSHSRRKEFAEAGASDIKFKPVVSDLLSAEEMKAIYEFQPVLNKLAGRPRKIVQKAKRPVTFQCDTETATAIKNLRVQFCKELSLSIGSVGVSDVIKRCVLAYPTQQTN